MLNRYTHHATVVRSPDVDRLTVLIRQAGGTVGSADDPSAVRVTGVDTSQIGELAARNAIVLHELTPQHESLEAAFLELTEDSAEFRAPVVQS